MFVITIVVSLIIIYFKLPKRCMQSQHASVIEIFIDSPKVNEVYYISEIRCWEDYIFTSKGNINAVLATWKRQNTILPQAVISQIVATIVNGDYP